MAQVQRRTIVVHDRLAMRELRLDAAHHRRHGLQIITFEQLAARLAGGLLRPVDDESLRAAIQAVLPATNLGELDGIKDLPGMVSAAVDTLRKAWLADIDLHARAAEHSPPALDCLSGRSGPGSVARHDAAPCGSRGGSARAA